MPNISKIPIMAKKQKPQGSNISKKNPKIYAPSGRVGPSRSGENLDILETLERKAEGNVGNLETLELSLGEVIVAHPLADHAWGRTSPSPFPTLVCHAGRGGGGEHIYIYIYIYVYVYAYNTSMIYPYVYICIHIYTESDTLFTYFCIYRHIHLMSYNKNMIQ